MQNIEKTKLESLSIHELRDLARQIGVHLPTTFKRDDLCDEIMKIVLGEKEPYRRKTKQGRPPKIARKFSDIAEVLIPQNNINDYNNISTFAVPDFIFRAENIQYNACEEISFKGYLKVLEGYGIIRSLTLELAYITLNYINEYSLVSGDYIEGTCKFIEDNRRIVNNITMINDLSSKDYEYKKISKTHDVQFENIDDNKIAIGGTNVLYKNSFDIKEFALKFVNCSFVVLININSKKDSGVNKISANTYECNLNFNLSDKEIYEYSSLIFDVGKRRAEFGTCTTIIVNNLSEFIKANNRAITNNVVLSEIKPVVVRNIKNLLLSSFTSEHSRFTIIDIENPKMQKIISDLFEFELNQFFSNID